MKFLLFRYCLIKHLDNIIQFLLKISLIWWDKFIYNFKYIFTNKKVLIKKIVIVVSKLTRSRVLRGGVGLRGALRDRDEIIKFSLSCGASWGWGKIKPCSTGQRLHSSSGGFRNFFFRVVIKNLKCKKLIKKIEYINITKKKKTRTNR